MVPSATNDDVLQLVRRIQQTGCEDAFNIICELYTKILKANLCKRGMKSEDAEDLAQEVMAKLLVNKFKDYDPERGSVKAYILKWAVNRYRDFYRSRGTKPPTTTLEFDPPAPEPTSDVDELMARFHDAILSLPESQRQVMLLHMEGLSTATIAEHLDTTKDAVSMLLHRARQALVSLLGLTLPPSKRGRPRKQPTA